MKMNQTINPNNLGKYGEALSEQYVFYTVTDLARLLHLHYQTVLSEIHAGRLGSYKFKGHYRISEEQLQDYLRKCNN